MWFKISLPLSYSRYAPNSKELFLLILLGLSPAHFKSHGSLKHFHGVVNSAEPRDIPSPSKTNQRLFILLRYFSGSVLCFAPTTHFPCIQYSQISQLENTWETTWKKPYSFLFYCGSFQSLSDLEHFVGNLLHCCFSGREKRRCQGRSKSTFSLLQNLHIILIPSVQKQHKWQCHD